MFVGSQSFSSLPSFMFVSAAVSEIHENKKEKQNSEIGYFQFITFPGHIICPFLTRGTSEHTYTFSLLEVPYTTN